MNGARSIDEILGGARGELQERETKLTALASRVKTELDDVRRALKKLGVPKTTKSATTSQPDTPRADPVELREQILAALQGSLEPLSASEVTAACPAATTPQGVAMKLRHMLREGVVVQIGSGWGLSSKVATEDED